VSLIIPWRFGQGILTGLGFFTYTGMSIYIGTVDIFAHFLVLSGYPKRAGNPAGFCFLVCIIIAFGLLFLVTDLLGSKIGFEKAIRHIYDRSLFGTENRDRH